MASAHLTRSRSTDVDNVLRRQAPGVADAGRDLHVRGLLRPHHDGDQLLPGRRPDLGPDELDVREQPVGLGRMGPVPGGVRPGRRDLAAQRGRLRPVAGLHLGRLGDRAELLDHPLGPLVLRLHDGAGVARDLRPRDDVRLAAGGHMSTKGVIFGLVGLGVVVAIVLGLLGQSQTVAEKRFCNSLADLQTSVQTLTSLNAGTAGEGDVQSALSGVQSAWSDVKNDALNLHSENMSELDGAWDKFTGAVKSIPSSSSASDAAQAVSSATQGLQSTAASNIKSHDCSNT